MTNIYKLSNGITVVMETMPYLKSAAFGVWVRVGSANEDDSNNGIAHMI
jgi:predicted Zn-dependent peptidase